MSSPVRQTARDTVPASRAAACPTGDGMLIRSMMAMMSIMGMGMGSKLYIRGWLYVVFHAGQV